MSETSEDTAATPWRTFEEQVPEVGQAVCTTTVGGTFWGVEEDIFGPIFRIGGEYEDHFFTSNVHWHPDDETWRTFAEEMPIKDLQISLSDGSSGRFLGKDTDEREPYVRVLIEKGESLPCPLDTKYSLDTKWRPASE